MLKIRLRRMGKKKAPTYRIIVADAASPRDGRFIEEIGIYDPNPDKALVRIDAEAAKKWLGCGAKPTDIVAKLFKAEGIEKGAACEEAADEEPEAETPEQEAEAEAPAEEAPAEEAEAEAPAEEAPAEEAEASEE